MSNQTFDRPFTISFKSLIYLAFIVTRCKAEPILRSSRVGGREMNTASPNEDLMTVKNVLGWLFAAAAMIIIAAGFAWRTLYLRTRNKPLRDFFTFIEAPRPRRRPSRLLIRPSSGGLASIPHGRQWGSRVHATDTDPEGRREGGPDPDDANGNLIGKDILPPYEVKGGPPNYGQFLAVDLGADTSARLQVNETLPAGMSQSRLLDPSPATMDPPTQTSPPLDVQLPHPPPPSYSPTGYQL